jgi:hypothetical protein
VSAKQIKVSWKKGGQIAKTNRHDHAELLTKFIIGEIARGLAAYRGMKTGC